MNRKLCLAGLILNCIAALMLIVKECFDVIFPLPVKIVLAACFLAGLAANLTILHESRKNAKKNEASKQ